MWRRAIPVVFLVAGCARHAAAPRGAGPSRSLAVVTVPPPPRDGGAVTAPARSTDAGSALDAETARPLGASGARADGGLSFRLSFTLSDGGPSFIVSGSYARDGGPSLAQLSPVIIVRSALLVRVGASSNHLLMLFDHRAGCVAPHHPHGPQVTLQIDWKRGSSTNFDNTSITSGRSEHYKGRIEVLSAPVAPGSTGTIRLDPIPGGNVRGGRVRVRVCR